jgi:hypothetical protein
MTKAIGSLRAVVVATLASVVITACGGGAQTVENQQIGGGNTGGSTQYTGPAPRDADVFKFQQELWAKARTTDRCGSCHNESVGQTPMFVRNDDVNMAYDEALTVTDTQQPSLSRLVEKVGEGHNCWVADPATCGAIMTTWIENWIGDQIAGGGRQIVLTPPTSVDPGSSRAFPDGPNDAGTNGQSFATTVYPLLSQYCSNCHTTGEQSPFFGDPNIDVAYEAAKAKMNLDSPVDSRFVVKLSPPTAQIPDGERHNCWSDCQSNSDEMLNAITLLANGIDPTTVDPNLVYSKALRLIDGTIASGGNRYEDAQVALWEFKTGNGTVAYDTSGVDPAIDLNLSQEVTWYGGWGITMNGGKAQGSTTSSAKLYDVIQESGEFSIEAWVVPANVTQEEARIVSYSAGVDARNFTLQQTLYNYDFRLRTNETSLNGEPALSTPDAAEVLQATLQHVVATYDPVNGRSIYVNGNLVTNIDPVPGGTLIDWQETFALVLGAEASGDGAFEGTLRMAAIHRRALTQAQIQQNFDVGVGEKFFLLFDISEIIEAAVESSYILFEVQQFDTYAYLFDRPHFVTLDGSAPEGIAIEGMRVAMNGREADVGQAYATLVDTLSGAEFEELGQPLSGLGAVLPLERGPDLDEFFLTFDRLHLSSYDRPENPMLILTPTDLDPASHIGVRTFDEINATFSALTGVTPQFGDSVDTTYQELRQSLPAVEDVDTFLSSHQVALAQLAIEYCNAMVEDTGLNASMFPNFNFNAPAVTEFNAANRVDFVDPLIARFIGNSRGGAQILTQPSFDTVNDELALVSAGGGRPDNLIDRLLSGSSDTRAIAKGVCAATLGNAATLVQ